MTIEKVLAMCCECGKIRIDNENNVWISQEENPQLYNKFYEKFKLRITHSYCPEDFKKAEKEIEEYLNPNK